MRKATIRKIWMLGFLMATLVSGCGREQVTAPVTPFVISTIPANGATGVPVTQIVSATFSEVMNATTFTSGTFTLTGPGGASVAGTVAYSGVTATFTPTAHLAGSTLYTATITTGAKDLINDPLAANVVWTFTTAPIPTVIATVPLNGAVAVPLNQKLSATFSIPMNPATLITPGTFILAVGALPGGTSVAGTVVYDASSNSAIFSPTTALTATTQYTATITTAAQSTQGNSLAINFNWTFTTGAAANATAPTVILTNPLAGAVNVPLNQRIAATFSVPMNPATISAAGTFTLAVTTGGAAVLGAVSYSGNTAVFTPTANLGPSTQYTATITTAAKDLTGVAMAANYVWSFTTGLTANAGAPTVIANESRFNSRARNFHGRGCRSRRRKCSRNRGLRGQYRGVQSECEFDGQHSLHRHNHNCRAKSYRHSNGRQLHMEFHNWSRSKRRRSNNYRNKSSERGN
jgi:hypothetical protein